MIRPLATLAFVALGLGAAVAQDAQPATPEIVVDPAATIDTTPKNANLLTGLYATRAVVEICAVTLEQAVLDGIAFDQRRLETGLGMDAAMAERAYGEVKADVQTTAPDCAEGSPDRISVEAVAAIYAAQAAAASPATPAAPADPAAPAAPAQ